MWKGAFIDNVEKSPCQQCSQEPISTMRKAPISTILKRAYSDNVEKSLGTIRADAAYRQCGKSLYQQCGKSLTDNVGKSLHRQCGKGPTSTMWNRANKMIFASHLCKKLNLIGGLRKAFCSCARVCKPSPNGARYGNVERAYTGNVEKSLQRQCGKSLYRQCGKEPISTMCK